MSERVDKSKIYERFTRVTKQTKDLVDSMEELQSMMTAVLEENAELSIETSICIKCSNKASAGNQRRLDRFKTQPAKVVSRRLSCLQ